ncbi:MAG: type II toxin-antitoxin system RelE/ParE family toxin [Caldilineaceae bacterium]|nr:type II toxin-antitoxin system RelE/ParE family toxin [Caldilineaceae bacterium]
MKWRVQYTRTFLKELSRLPGDIRAQVEAIAFGEGMRDDPYLAGKAQKLSGFQTFYKIRIDDYRIGIQIDTDERLVEFQRVLHRREIYRKFP